MIRTSPATTVILKSQKEPENKLSRRRARQETMRLLYELPKKALLLEEEDCSAFVLFCSNSIDKYIDMYDASIATYENFIQAIIKRRMKSFHIRQEKIKNRQDYGEVLYYRDADIYEAAEEKVPYATPRTPWAKMPALFSSLIKPRPSILSHPNHPQRYVERKISTRINRRGFLLLISTFPEQVLSVYPKEFRLLLGLEKEEFFTYFGTMETLLFPQQIQMEKIKKSISLHYFHATYAQKSREKETDITGMEQSIRKELYNMTRYRSLARKYSEKTIRVSHSTLSEVLGIPAGTVNSSIFAAKRFVKEAYLLMDDNGTNGYR
jgi:hypothetical protein